MKYSPNFASTLNVINTERLKMGFTVVYHIVEVTSSRGFNTIANFANFRDAAAYAYSYSAGTGLTVEIQNDLGHVLDSFTVRRDR